MKTRIITNIGRLLLTAIVLAAIGWNCYGQQTVFGLLKNNLKLADKYYEEKNFRGALDLCLSASREKAPSPDIVLRIARCYYSLKEYPRATAYYDRYIEMKRNLPWTDVYYYAEAQATTGNYETAIIYYQKYLAKDRSDELVIKKIWRLSNAEYLFEDSAHYEVRPLPINTESGELCALPHRDGIVFMSNRKEPHLVEKVNASINAPFYRMYYSKVIRNGNSIGTLHYGEVSSFDKVFASNLNVGPVAFYDKEKKMVFVSTATEPGNGGTRTLQLHFAEKMNGQWEVTGEFPFNSVQYSISDPTISEDGRTLYFSSDMGGGFGGKDIYKSTLDSGKWSRPVNLGEMINTRNDETFPFLYQNRSLYFSSNGHPGLGGLDIFRAAIKADGFSEPQNAGYPINSGYDDFGMVIDSLETHGYFSSNRNNGGYDDDLYEFDMDVQTYPVTITGLVRYKERAWSDSSELNVMPRAKIYLIDNLRNIQVQEGVTDANGNFSVVIPYFSQYVVRVVGEDGGESVVVLEIPRHKKQMGVHEIVIIKDVFESNNKQAR